MEDQPLCGLAQYSENYKATATIDSPGYKEGWNNYLVDLTCLTCGLMYLGRKVNNQSTEQQAIDTARATAIFFCKLQNP